MNISKKGREELIKSEGVRKQIYDDWTGKIVSSYSEITGYPTIGVGHLITDTERDKWKNYFKNGNELTSLQIDLLLKEDIKKFTKPLNDELKVPVTQQMYDALVSYSFNVGNNSSWRKKIIDKINEKDYQGAAEIMGMYPTTSKGNVLQGLVRRRAKESEMFLSGGMPTFFTPIKNTITTYPITTTMLLFSTSFYLYKSKRKKR